MQTCSNTVSYKPARLKERLNNIDRKPGPFWVDTHFYIYTHRPYFSITWKPCFMTPTLAATC